jgi:hypothetical protein
MYAVIIHRIINEIKERRSKIPVKMLIKEKYILKKQNKKEY